MRVRDCFDAIAVDPDHRARGDQRIDYRFFGACTAAVNSGSIRELRSILTVWTSDLFALAGLAVENATNRSPEPLPDTLPVRASPIVSRRAIRFS